MPNKIPTEAKRIRLKLRYSIKEMAQALGLVKATYQHYDEGSRAVPEKVLHDARVELKRCQLWAMRYLPGGAFDQDVAKLHPSGVPNEIKP